MINLIIYKATNKINGKVYIGQTRETLLARKSGHLKRAKSGYKTHFYNAIRKYGEDSFDWDIICTAYDKETLNELETFFIEKYDSINSGYNMVDSGDNNVMDIPEVRENHRVRMQSAETRKKLSDTMKKKIAEGRFFTPEHRARLSESAKGNHNFGTGDTRSLACYCITESGDRLDFHSYRDAWKWWQNVDNHFDTKAECIYQRKIKQSIAQGYYSYKKKKYKYPKWYKKEGDNNEEVSN